MRLDLTDKETKATKMRFPESEKAAEAIMLEHGGKFTGVLVTTRGALGWDDEQGLFLPCKSVPCETSGHDSAFIPCGCGNGCSRCKGTGERLRTARFGYDE